MTADKEAFLQQILQERDRLFRETSRLNSQLASLENFESERDSYTEQLNQKEETIRKLKQQVEMLLRRIWGKSSERYINEDHCKGASILKDLTCSLKKKNLPPAPKRRSSGTRQPVFL